MSATQSELQKEFELERMILFSDAVFAIAITLLIIEIKFPEVPKDATVPEIEELLKPVIIRFLGFILSFFFIGLMWARHLKTFKYLKKYDNGVIYRNLVLLFFIVCFPFTVVALVLVIGVAVVFLVSLIFLGNTMYVLYSFYVVPVMMLFVRKALKKYKPVKPLTVRRSGT